MTRIGAARATVPGHWSVTDRVKVRGRWVEVGTEISVRGERGRFRVLRYVTTTRGASWLDVRDAHGGWRSFRPDRVRRVHLGRTMRPAGDRVAA